MGEIRVGIFAKQNISIGTELAYDYNFEWYGGAKVRCLCGAVNCSGFLGAKSRGFQVNFQMVNLNLERIWHIWPCIWFETEVLMKGKVSFFAKYCSKCVYNVLNLFFHEVVLILEISCCEYCSLPYLCFSLFCLSLMSINIDVVLELLINFPLSSCSTGRYLSLGRWRWQVMYSYSWCIVQQKKNSFLFVRGYHSFIELFWHIYRGSY